MKEKSDISKILEGRCRGAGADYVGFKKANEAHSTGTASEIYDPVAKRTVDTLSTGETMLFWLLRYDERVAEIREQMLLVPDLVAECALELGIRCPKKILTTDFLALYEDGSVVAYSVKYSRSIFDDKNAAGRSVIRRQALEKKYWEKLGIKFRIVFTEEMNRYKAVNISDCMNVYDSSRVHTIDQMYRWLIAHHVVEPDMSRPIPFAKVARENEVQIKKLYRKEVSAEDDDRISSKCEREKIPHHSGAWS